MTSVFERVYEALATIPPGRVVTYGQIAEHLGMYYGGRKVGWAMRHCPAQLPWHRVVNSQGRISLRSPGPFDLQRALLEDEGVQFDSTNRVDLSVYRWDGI
mgnify:CR=1 FL=1